MRTPAGFECTYFHGDYYRGRKQEECRLIGTRPAPDHWTPDLCKTCPVPGIQRANACTNMVLTARVNSLVLGIRRRVTITAYCSKAEANVQVPEIGCGLCHPFPDLFLESKD
jgi:hypothetical protein